MNEFELYGEIVIKAEKAKEEIDKILSSAKDLADGLGGVGTEADNTSGKLKDGSKFSSGCVWLGNTLSKLSEKTVKLISDLGKIGFGFNTSMEAYQYQFEALINDADKASQLIADLQELAKISPLGMEGLANNAVTLLTTGTELADILPTLEMLGNLSLGNTDRMNNVVRAYTQILGKGGLMAQEMYQLGDAMVPIVEIMTKYGGERYADGSWYQQKMADPKYKIPAEDMVKAFQAATSEGGKWNDYMLTIMDSFAGQADRLGEEGKETLGAFFQPFFDVAKEDILPKLVEGLAAFRTWVDENKEDIEAFANTVGTVLVGGFNLLLETVKLLTEAIGLLSDAWSTLKTNMTNINASITVSQQSVGSTVTQKTGSSFLGNLSELIVRNSAVNPDAPWLPTWNAEGAIFSKPTIFNTRLGLQGVGEAGAEAVAPIDKLQQYVSDAVRGTVGGMQFNVVLDSGVLVGQLAPQMDERLGKLGNRKRRGN